MWPLTYFAEYIKATLLKTLREALCPLPFQRKVRRHGNQVSMGLSPFHSRCTTPPTAFNFKVTDLFETLQAFSTWSEDVHVVWIYHLSCCLPYIKI